MSTSIDDFFASIRAGARAEVEAALATEPGLATAHDAAGVSALLWACYTRQAGVLEVLRARVPAPAFHEAAALGDLARLEVCLAAEPALRDAASPDGFTALHLAAFFAHPAIAERLLALGADPNVVAANPTRVTPLHSAVAARQVAIVRALLAHGAAPDARQQQGWTALMAAAQHGDEALAGLLLEHGAEPALASDDGRTAADLAAEKGHAALAGRLRAAEGPRFMKTSG